jgi:hypothetical protein
MMQRTQTGFLSAVTGSRTARLRDRRQRRLLLLF